MLFELLPHFARLVPMAEKFFATRSTRELEEEAALTALAASVRSELGQVAETHAGIRRTLQEQGAQVSEIAVEATRTRIGVEHMEARLAKLERSARVGMTLTAVALTMLAGALVLLAIVLVHLAHR
jgi:hypothetical protein